MSKPIVVAYDPATSDRAPVNFGVAAHASRERRSSSPRPPRRTPCPIAIVPPGWEAGGGLNTIGVAYVGSEEGREALRGGYALARPG